MPGSVTEVDALAGYQDPQVQRPSGLLPPGSLFLSQQACLLQGFRQRFSPQCMQILRLKPSQPVTDDVCC